MPMSCFLTREKRGLKITPLKMPVFGNAESGDKSTCRTAPRSGAVPERTKDAAAPAQVLSASLQEALHRPPRLLPALAERAHRACAVLIGLSGGRNLSALVLEPPPPSLRPAHAFTGPSRNLARLGARPYFAGNWLSQLL